MSPAILLGIDKTHVSVPKISAVERPEGQTGGGLDDGLRLAVQPELAVMAVAGPELLARHGERASGAVSHEHRIRAGRDEHPTRFQLNIFEEVYFSFCILNCMFSAREAK